MRQADAVTRSGELNCWDIFCTRITIRSV